MPNINPEDYEALTVAELKEIADSLGVDIPSDARKAEIIEILAAADKTTTREVPSSPEETDPRPEQQNVYEHQMSSTETALLSPEDYRKLKLIF